MLVYDFATPLRAIIILKNIIDIIYSILILLISKFTISNNFWVLGAREGYAYADNSRYLFEWLLSNSDDSCFWVTKSKIIYEKLLSEGKPVLYFYNIKNIFSIARAEYIVCTHSYTGNDVFKFVNHNKKLITLWHGVPLKKMGNGNNNNWSIYKRRLYSILKIKYQPDLFLATSGKDIKVFSDAYNISTNRFYIGCYPRISDLINNAKEEKTILYAPTFRDGQLQEYYDINVFPSVGDLEELNTLLSAYNYIFKIKLHPYTLGLFPNTENFSNIEISSKDEDIQELLYEAEILVTDYSSVYFDFLALDREIVFLIPDFSWYENEKNRGLLYEYDDVTPGKKVTSWVGLTSHISSCIKTEQNYSSERQKLLIEFFNGVSSSVDDLYQRCRSL